MIFGKIHIQTTEVPFHLVDAGQALYHANYYILFDQARSQALQQAGYPAVELWNEGFALALVESSSRYFKPAAYGQKIAVFTRTLWATGSSITVRHIMVPGEAAPGPAANGFFPGGSPLPDEKSWIHDAKLTLVCVRLNPLRPTRIPARLVGALNLAEARRGAPSLNG